MDHPKSKKSLVFSSILAFLSVILVKMSWSFDESCSAHRGLRFAPMSQNVTSVTPSKHPRFGGSIICGIFPLFSALGCHRCHGNLPIDGINSPEPTRGLPGALGALGGQNENRLAPPELWASQDFFN